MTGEERRGRETLVVVCRADQIRSPLMAGLVRGRLAEDGRVPVDVRSAGLHADEDAAPTAETIGVAREWGVDLAQHRSTVLTADLACRAALVVTMTGEQRAGVARLAPVLTARTFTLVELVRLTEALDGLPPRTWGDLAHLAHRRRPFVAAPTAPEDVPDPVGRDPRYLRKVADDLAGLCRRLVAVGPAPVVAHRQAPGWPDAWGLDSSGESDSSGAGSASTGP